MLLLVLSMSVFIALQYFILLFVYRYFIINSSLKYNVGIFFGPILVQLHWFWSFAAKLTIVSLLRG